MIHMAMRSRSSVIQPTGRVSRSRSFRIFKARAFGSAISQAWVELLAGQTVRLRTMALRSGGQLGARTVIENAAIREIPVTYHALTRDIRPGARILIDDGLVELKADRIVDGAVECTVIAGGRCDVSTKA